MDHQRLTELLDAYLEQRLSEPDRAALNAELVASAAARELFWEYVHQHAMLAELLAEARGRRLAGEEVAVSRRAVRRWPTWAAALAAGLVWLLRPGSDSPLTDPPPSQARLADLRGEVTVVVGDSRLRARHGQVILPGEEVHTGEGSFAVVAYDDESRLELHADTAVRLLEEDEAVGAALRGGPASSKRVFLVKGALNALVAPQPEGRPMVLRTLQADLFAPGARFSSASVQGETRIELEQGRAVLSRKGSPSIEIHTGTYAIAAPELEVLAAPLLPAGSEPRAVLDERSGPVLGMAVSPDGRTIATAGSNGLVQLWDVAGRRVRAALDAGQKRALSVQFSPDQRLLAAGYETLKQGDGVVIWDLERKAPQQRIPLLRNVHALSFTPDSQTLALATPVQRFKGALIWDLGDVRERLALGSHADLVSSLAVSPDGRVVAAGCRDGRIRLWDIHTGRADFTLEGHARDVQSLAFQPGGQLLASGSRDGSVRLWSPLTGEELRALTGPFKEVRCLAFSPDGRTLATGHAGVAILWDVRTGQQRSTLKAHKFAVTGIAYLPDGQTLVTAGWDRTVKLWDLRPAEGH